MRQRIRIDSGHDGTESESSRLLLVLLTIREASAQRRSQSVAVNRLCSECIGADDVKRIRAQGWIHLGEDTHEREVSLTEEGEVAWSTAVNAISLGTSGNDIPRPHWNPVDRELVFNGRVLKHFTRSGPNQECILDRFEQLGWPRRIENPLPEKEEIVAATRLRDAIKQLNRTLETAAIRFRADGTGSGVIWVDTSTSTD